MTSRASIPRAFHSPYRTMLEVIRRINPANFLYAAEIAQHTLTLAQLRPAVNDYFFILCERTKGSLCRRRATIGTPSSLVASFPGMLPETLNLANFPRRSATRRSAEASINQLVVCRCSVSCPALDDQSRSIVSTTLRWFCRKRC